MKIFRIILHSIVFLAGLLLILDLSVLNEIKHLIIFALLAYCLAIPLVSVIKELLAKAFPRHINLLVVSGFFSYLFVTKNYSFFELDKLIAFFIYAATIASFVLIIFSFTNISIKPTFKKIKVDAYSRYFSLNLIFYFIFLISSIFVIFSNEKGNHTVLVIKITALLLALFPLFNKNYIRRFKQALDKNRNLFDIGLTINQLGVLSKIRNFVFSKDRIISSGIYQIMESDYRSTIRVTTATQLARQLAEEWNHKYTRLFTNDEYEKSRLKYHIIEKNENGISVIDDDACLYHFGNSAFVKDVIKKDEYANLFLVKNELPIAKFRVNEKITNDKVELMNELDYFGNTILFNPGIIEDLGYDYTIMFDKIYSGTTPEKQLELLRDLEKKAPTAHFTAKNPKQIPNAICCYVSSNIDIKNEEKKIVLNSEKLFKIPEILRLAKKMHTMVKYALYFSILFQLLLIIFAFLNSEKIILIYGFNFAFFMLAELLGKAIAGKLFTVPAS